VKKFSLAKYDYSLQHQGLLLTFEKNQTNMYYISFLLIIESIIRTVIFLYLVKTTPGVTIT